MLFPIGFAQIAFVPEWVEGARRSANISGTGAAMHLTRRQALVLRRLAPVLVFVFAEGANLVLSATDPAVGFVLALVLALQFDLVLELRERRELEDGTSRLFRLAERHPETLDLLIRMLEGYGAVVDEARVPEFPDEASDRLALAVGDMEQLGEGRLVKPRGDNQLMMDQYERATSVIRATTDANDLEWWLSATGASYLEKNRRTVERGVRIRRIFLVDEDDDGPLWDVIRANRDAGVEATVARSASIPGRLNVNMTLFDDELCHVDRTNSAGVTVEYLYTTNPSDLRRYASIFSQLEARAQHLETS